MKRPATRFAAGLCAALLLAPGAPAGAEAFRAGYETRAAAYGGEIAAQYAEEVLALVNEERRQRGRSPLKLSWTLMDAAAVRAEELTVSFSHTRPNGESCTSMIEDGAYTVGENIAAGYATPEETVAQWMESPGHRANILNEDYTELGVGYFYREDSEYRHYWVQLFRRPMSKAVRYR